MNEESCDIHDVSKTASNLVSYGSSLGLKHGFDSLERSRFSLQIATLANGVIRDVHEGTISAWEGMQKLQAEYYALRKKAWFYTKNGIGVAGGTMQGLTGYAILKTPIINKVARTAGVMLVGHGVNNVIEGGANIYNGPDAPATTGPTRKAYQEFFGDCGDTAYHSADVVLSGYSLFRSIRKPDSVQLFPRRDPLNYVRAYRPMLHSNAGRIALGFEVIVDLITLDSLMSVSKCNPASLFESADFNK